MNKENNIKEINMNNELKYSPFIKIGGLIPFTSKKTIGTPKNELIEKIKEMEYKEDIIREIEEYIKKRKLAKEIIVKPAEPVLGLILDNGEMKWIEGQPTGVVKLQRTDGKIGYLNLTKNEMISIEWGHERLRGWIAYEMEFSPLPNTIVLDSNSTFNIIQTIIANKSNFAEAKNLRALADLAMTIAVGLAILFIGVVVVPSFFGIDSLAWIQGFLSGGANATTTQATINTAATATGQQTITVPAG